MEVAARWLFSCQEFLKICKICCFQPCTLGKVLSLAKKTSHSGNPWVSVLISWFLVQVSKNKQVQNNENVIKDI